MGDAGLVGPGIPPLPIDRAEDGGGIVGIEEGTGAVVDRLPRDGHVVGVHHAMDEADLHPAGNQGGLSVDDRLEERQRRLIDLREAGIVAAKGMGEERRGERGIGDGRRILKRADADMTCRHAHEHRAGEGLLAEDRFAGGGDGEAPRRGDAEGMHRLTDEHLAEHRPQRRSAVTAARVAGAPRPLQLEVVAGAVGGEVFAEEDGAAVAEVREMAVLVAGIGLGDRVGSGGEGVAGKHGGAVGLGQARGVEAERRGERGIEIGQAGAPHRHRSGAGEQPRREPRVGVVEAPAGGIDRGGHAETCGGHAAGKRGAQDSRRFGTRAARVRESWGGGASSSRFPRPRRDRRASSAPPGWLPGRAPGRNRCSRNSCRGTSPAMPWRR